MERKDTKYTPVFTLARTLVIYSMRKVPIVLIEAPVVKNETVDSFISQLAQQGREVICTTQNQPLSLFSSIEFNIKKRINHESTILWRTSVLYLVACYSICIGQYTEVKS